MFYKPLSFFQLHDGLLRKYLEVCGKVPRRGECRIFYDLEPYAAVAVCGLGYDCLSYNKVEKLDEGREAIRVAAATGVKALQNQAELRRIHIESMGDAESAAEGAYLGRHVCQEFKNPSERISQPQLHMHIEKDDCNWDGWRIGTIKAEAQNLTRDLQDAPANIMTPTKFAQQVVNILCMSGVNVDVKVKGWAEQAKMAGFLNVAKGSCQPPIFLELSYYGDLNGSRPIVLVGQGNTYDSGGICAKKCPELEWMRGDMTGAACVVSICKAIANLEMPVNVKGLIPLCEHMIGCNAMKPGDVIQAANGKKIEVTNADSEGPLVLIDALLYAQSFAPKFVVDISTLSHSATETFGHACCGAFTNSERLWKGVRDAAAHTGDRVWRMPLWEFFGDQIKNQQYLKC